MTTETVRWNIAVSPETDQALRLLLAKQRGRKGDLSRFIEDAVRARIFEATAHEAKAQNADTSAAEIDAAIREALAWAKTA